MRRLTPTALLLALAIVAGACGSSGRDLQPAQPGQTAPPRRTSTTFASSSTISARLTLSSPAIQPAGRIPIEYTCDGAGTSPPLSWSGTPEDANSLALIVTNADAAGAVQWLVVNIPKTTLSVTKGTAPTGAIELTTSFGSKGWTAPCSDTIDTYEFTLLAFTDPPNVEQAADPKAAVATLLGTATASATFTAKSGRGGSGTTR